MLNKKLNIDYFPSIVCIFMLKIANNYFAIDLSQIRCHIEFNAKVVRDRLTVFKMSNTV